MVTYAGQRAPRLREPDRAELRAWFESLPPDGRAELSERFLARHFRGVRPRDRRLIARGLTGGAYHTWSSGDQLFAADLMSNLMQQVIVQCLAAGRPGSPVLGEYTAESDGSPGPISNVWDTGPNAWVPGGQWMRSWTYETETLLGSDGTISWTGIPGTFTDLMIVFEARSASANTLVAIRFNNDSAANYDVGQLAGTGALGTVVSSAATAQVAGACGEIDASTETANATGLGIVIIPNYAATTFNKTSQATTSYATAANQRNEVHCTNWRSTAALTRIDLSTSNAIGAWGAGNFKAGSRFRLYAAR